MKKLSIAAAAVVLVMTTAGGCPSDNPSQKKPSDKFTRDCTVRGGHVVSERRGHGITPVCAPPAGGWQ